MREVRQIRNGIKIKYYSGKYASLYNKRVAPDLSISRADSSTMGAAESVQEKSIHEFTVKV